MTLATDKRLIRRLLDASPGVATKPLPPAARANLLSHACIASSKGGIGGSVTATVGDKAVNSVREHARSIYLAIGREP